MEMCIFSQCVCELAGFLLLEDVALQQEQGCFSQCSTGAVLTAVQNAITPPYSLGAKPQAQDLFSTIGHCRRVWIVIGIYSLEEDGLRAKRLA